MYCCIGWSEQKMKHWIKCQQMQGLCSCDVLWTCVGPSSPIICFLGGQSRYLLRQKNTHKLNHLASCHPRVSVLTDEGLWLCLWRPVSSVRTVDPGPAPDTLLTLTLSRLRLGPAWNDFTPLSSHFHSPQTSGGITRSSPVCSRW